MAMAPVCVAHRVLHPGAGPRCPLPPGPPCPAPLDTRPPSSPWGWRSSCSPVRGPWVSVLAVAVGPRVRGRRWAPCTPSCVWPGQLGDCQWPLLLPTHRSSAQKPCSPDLWALVLSSGGAGRALAPAPPPTSALCSSRASWSSAMAPACLLLTLEAGGARLPRVLQLRGDAVAGVSPALVSGSHTALHPSHGCLRAHAPTHSKPRSPAPTLPSPGTLARC